MRGEAMSISLERELLHAKVRAQALADWAGQPVRPLLAARLRYLALTHPFAAAFLMSEAYTLEQQV